MLLGALISSFLQDFWHWTLSAALTAMLWAVFLKAVGFFFIDDTSLWPKRNEVTCEISILCLQRLELLRVWPLADKENGWWFTWILYTSHHCLWENHKQAWQSPGSCVQWERRIYQNQQELHPHWYRKARLKQNETRRLGPWDEAGEFKWVLLKDFIT